MGSPIGESCCKQMLSKKIAELEQNLELIDKLDAHYGFCLLKIASAWKNSLSPCYLSASPVFLQKDLLEKN